MPVGVQLSILRRDLRAETGQSLNPAQGVQSQATQDNAINRQQRELWEEFAWPHLRYYVDLPLAESQRYYDYPASVTFDQITNIYAADDGNAGWRKLTYGIRAFDIPASGPKVGNPRQWANKPVVDASAGVTTNASGQIEITPVPGVLGTGAVLRIEAQAPITEMIADSDKCILDSTLIVLFASAEILATQKSESAALKLKKAQQYLQKLQANQGPDKRSNYNMGGSMRSSTSGRYVPGIDYIPS